MVSTVPPADESAVTMIRTRISGQTHRFATVDHQARCLRLNLESLATVIAEIVAEHTATLAVERDRLAARLSELDSEGGVA